MKNFSGITAKYISKPYKECPCMVLVSNIYHDLGFDFPSKFEDLTLDNYLDKYKSDPEKTQRKLLRLARSLGQPSSWRYPKIGDFVVVAQNPKRKHVTYPGFFAGIYSHRGQVMSSFVAEGVRLFRIDKYNRIIIARSLI